MENQMVMRLQKNEVFELKKHSSLIASSNRNISVPQRKMYNAILYLTSKQLQADPSQRKFKMRFVEIAKFSGYNGTTNGKYLKNSIKELTETVVEYNILKKDVNKWGVFSLISHATIEDYDEHITVEFPSIIIENIVYPNIYSLLNLSVVNSLQGKYSLPLYELLTDYKKVRKLFVSLESLREILGVDNGLYPKISNFKIKVLEPAIEEINSLTDLEVDFEFERVDSRSYTHIEFSIRDKNAELDPVETSAYMLLKSKGLPESSAKKFAKQLSKKNVIDAIESLEKAVKKGSVKNITAYLTKILKNIKIDDDLSEDVIQIAHPAAKSDYKPIIESSKNNLEFRKYIADRVSEIVSELSLSVFNNFIEEQNTFTIEHFISNNIIDENKKIVNLVALSENIVFRGWIEKKYLDENVEYKMFMETK